MRIYFIGVCGTGMGNVALLLRAQGHEVSGADTDVYPPMSDLLEDSDIEVYEGYSPERLEKISPDFVVVGNAVTRGNPEIELLLDTRRFPMTSLPALVRDQILLDRRSIVIAGTHGKTTTTALTAFLLRANGLDPGYLIGGVPRDLPCGANLGSPDAPFVIEGDEYDSAFFDKRSKFVHYRPNILVLNNLEFDHADIFRDLEDVQRSFSHLLRIVPGNGFVLVNGDDANLEALLPVSWTTVIRVGEGENNDLRISGFEEDENGSAFDLEWKGEPWSRVSWSLPGEYNARNAAMAVLVAALVLHPKNPTSLKLSTLKNFQGVKRRQEVLFSDDRLTVVDDFAHHPTALAATLRSLRARYAGRRLIACIEPRSNTVRTRVFQDSLCESLGRADLVLIGPIHRSEMLPPEERLNLERLCSDLKARDTTANKFAGNTDLLEAVKKECARQTDGKKVVCFFSNGAFDGIARALVEMLNS